MYKKISDNKNKNPMWISEFNHNYCRQQRIGGYGGERKKLTGLNIVYLFHNNI